MSILGIAEHSWGLCKNQGSFAARMCKRQGSQGCGPSLSRARKARFTCLCLSLPFLSCQPPSSPIKPMTCLMLLSCPFQTEKCLTKYHCWCTRPSNCLSTCQGVAEHKATFPARWPRPLTDPYHHLDGWFFSFPLHQLPLKTVSEQCFQNMNLQDLLSSKVAIS